MIDNLMWNVVKVFKKCEVNQIELQLRRKGYDSFSNFACLLLHFVPQLTVQWQHWKNFVPMFMVQT